MKSAAAPPFAVGDVVFVNHPVESWVTGKVEACGPNTARAVSTKKHATWAFGVRLTDAERKCSGSVLQDAAEWDLAHCDSATLSKTPDDLLQLTHLHDSTLLRCLYIRYMNDVVYTNIGAIIVALNPFNFQIPAYMEARMPKYLAERGSHITDKLLPHSWTQAHNTYTDMTENSQNQCILISGESGAGKTEATKIVMKYLSKVSSMTLEGARKDAAEAVLTNLVACSPVLESFGNAKTVRNDNSSRFGKLMKIKFDNDFVIIGAFTTKYLLEKSRIITAAMNERVYHAFYLALRSPIARDKYLFTAAPESYTSVNSGKCLDNSEFSTAEDYLEVCSCMERLGLSTAETHDIFKIAAFVVHQSNINFDADGEGSRVASGAQGDDALNAAARLLGVPPEVLVREYTSTKMSIMGEMVSKKLPKHKAVDVRDAFSKAVYDALFGSLVDRCNVSCDATTVPARQWIALLDIFGFEDFEKNSFEQLCINLANEALQGHYNEYIFARDMQECKKEGIDVVDVVCPDNSPCVQLIAGPRGILTMLDDECSLGKGTDATFFDNVGSTFEHHQYFLRKKTDRITFTVKHYAGDVIYDVTGWLEKNRDTLKPELQQCLLASSNKVATTLFAAPEGNAVPQPGQSSGKRATVGTFFKKQLEELMAVINSTNPHWIRCIKPHPAKKPKMFGGKYTINQLESSGVLGTVKIRKAGYPVRYAHKTFAMRYQAIAPLPLLAKTTWTPDKWKAQAALILTKAELLGKATAQVGKTLVFMKADAFPTLEKKNAFFAKAHVTKLQSVGKGFLRRLRLFHSGKARVVQRVGRGLLDRLALYKYFCDVNHERIEAERRAKAELQRQLEAQQRELEAMMLSEHHVRSDVVAEEAAVFKGYMDELQYIAENVARLKAEAEAEMRRRHEVMLRQQRLREAMGPLLDEETRDRYDIDAEEADDRRNWRCKELFRRVEIIYRGYYAKLASVETVERQSIERDVATVHPDWRSRLAELRHMHEVRVQRRALEDALQQHRARRSRERQEQVARAEASPRSLPERMLIPAEHPSKAPAAARELMALTDSSNTAFAVDLSPQRLQFELAAGAAARDRVIVTAQAALDKSARVRSRVNQLRSVELRSRVYCPLRSSKGTVIAIGPQVRHATAFGAHPPFQVCFDATGECVWLELDDVLPADDDDAVRTVPAALALHRPLGRAAPVLSSTTAAMVASPPSPSRSVVGRQASPEQGSAALASAAFNSWQAQMAALEEDGW